MNLTLWQLLRQCRHQASALALLSSSSCSYPGMRPWQHGVWQTRSMRSMDMSVQAKWWLLPAGILNFVLGAFFVLAAIESFHTQGRASLHLGAPA